MGTYDDEMYDDDDYYDDEEDVEEDESGSSRQNPFSQSSSGLPGRNRAGASSSRSFQDDDEDEGDDEDESNATRTASGSLRGRYGVRPFGNSSQSEEDEERPSGSRSGSRPFGSGSQSRSGEGESRQPGASGSRYGSQGSSGSYGSQRFGGGSQGRSGEGESRQSGARFGSQGSSGGSASSAGGGKPPSEKGGQEAKGDGEKKSGGRFGFGGQGDKKDDSKKEAKGDGDKKSGGIGGRLGLGGKGDKKDDSKPGDKGGKKEQSKEGGSGGVGKMFGAAASGVRNAIPGRKKGDQESGKPSQGGASQGGGTQRQGSSPGARPPGSSQGSSQGASRQGGSFRSGQQAGSAPSSSAGRQSSYGQQRSQGFGQQQGSAAKSEAKSGAPKKDEKKKGGGPGIMQSMYERLPFVGPRAKQQRQAAGRSSKTKSSKVPKRSEQEGLSLDDKLDILGVGMFFAALVIFFSSLSGQQGALTGAINTFLSQLLGWGAVGVPVALAAIGIWLIVRHFGEDAPEIDPVRIAGLAMMYVGLLMILMIVETFVDPIYGLVTQETFAIAVERSTIAFGEGGGWIGAQLYTIMVTSIGEIPAFFAVLGWMVVSIMLTTRTSAAELAMFIISIWRSLRVSVHRRAQRRRAERMAAQEQQSLQAQGQGQSRVQVSKPEQEALASGSESSGNALPEPESGDVPIEERGIPIRIGGQMAEASAESEGTQGQQGQSQPPPPSGVPGQQNQQPAASGSQSTPSSSGQGSGSGGALGRLGRAIPGRSGSGGQDQGQKEQAAASSGSGGTLGRLGRALPGRGGNGNQDKAEEKDKAQTQSSSGNRLGRLGRALPGRGNKSEAAETSGETDGQDSKRAGGANAAGAAAGAAAAAVGSVFNRNKAQSGTQDKQAAEEGSTEYNIQSASPRREGKPSEKQAGESGTQRPAASRSASTATGESQRDTSRFAPPERRSAGSQSRSTAAGSGAAQGEGKPDESDARARFGRPASKESSKPRRFQADDADEDEDEDNEADESVRSAGSRTASGQRRSPFSSSTSRFGGQSRSDEASGSAKSEPAARSSDVSPETPPEDTSAARQPAESIRGSSSNVGQRTAQGSDAQANKDDKQAQTGSEKRGESSPASDRMSRLDAIRSGQAGKPASGSQDESKTDEGSWSQPERSTSGTSQSEGARRSPFRRPSGEDKPAAAASDESATSESESKDEGEPARQTRSGLFNRGGSQRASSEEAATHKPDDKAEAAQQSEKPEADEAQSDSDEGQGLFGKAASAAASSVAGAASAAGSSAESAGTDAEQQDAEDDTDDEYEAPPINPDQHKAPAPVQKPQQQPTARSKQWKLPEYQSLLASGSEGAFDRDTLVKRARIIEETLQSFGAPGRVVEINTGPVITQYGVEPDYLTSRNGKKSRVKVSAIAQLDKDLQLALGAKSIRIEAPVPGKGFVGVEVPNEEASLVSLRDVMESRQFQKIGQKSQLAIALGQSVDGAPVSADLSQMPHLLIAGTTGSGKSVCVNSIILSLLVRNTPEQMKFIMVDPKRVELTGYNGVPHLVAPVVVELERIVGVLKWVTREMDERYKKFSNTGARNIEDFNAHRPASEPNMPYIVVIIDELADLMMLAPDETERVITRIAALARATGIHLVIATQRPSVDVVTGLIKANFPARIAFAVAGSVDSRVILDQPGAERLLGKGDMLYLSPESPAPNRLQGVYVSDMEINNVNRYWKAQGSDVSQQKPITALVNEDADTTGEKRSVIPKGERFKQTPPASESGPQRAFWEETAPSNPENHSAGYGSSSGDANGHEDELYEEAVELVRRLNKASVSLLQRRLRIGYTRAARLIDVMESEGIVGPPTEGSKPREVLPPKS